jgi:uncharacterized protein (TIGR03086 family)
MDVLERIDKASQAALGVIPGIQAEHLQKQTPCTDWDVHALMDHMIGSMRFFAARAAGDMKASPQPVSTTSCEEAAQQLRDGIKAAAEAWHRPGALDGTLQAPWGEVPAEFMANITVTEMLMHGWDLAHATGQRMTVDDAFAEDQLTLARAALTPDRRAPAFGPEVQAPPNAPAIHRLAAFMGRQP